MSVHAIDTARSADARNHLSVVSAEHTMPVDAAAYRDVFRRHAAGVVVITGDAGNGPAGFTATSLVSVSLLPPLVSFAIGTTASAWPTVLEARNLAVNFLDAGQHGIARRFATSGIDRFAAPTRWSRLETGEPVLDEAPGYLRTQVEHRFGIGDHHLVVARILTHTRRRDHDPLIYHDGRYGTARPLT